MFTAGQHVSIELETMSPPFRVHGIYKAEDDEYLKVEGTVGDDIGNTILVPKSKIKLVHVS